MKVLIETLEAAGYTNNHGFPDDYYVKEYIAEDNVTQYAIITIHENNWNDLPYEFQIAHAGPDWNEPVDFYCSPDHDTSSITDTIWEANQIIKKNEG